MPPDSTETPAGDEETPEEQTPGPGSASGSTKKGGSATEQLGDAGKRALEAERQARQSAEKDAKEARDQAAQMQKQIQGIQSALGIKDGEDDPEKLLEAVQAENRLLKLERTVSSAAIKAGADHDLLWAHLRTSGKLDALDPTADDLSTKLDELVKEAVTAKPNLLNTRSGGGSGGPRGGSIGGNEPGMSDWIRQQAGRSS